MPAESGMNFVSQRLLMFQRASFLSQSIRSSVVLSRKKICRLFCYSSARIKRDEFRITKAAEVSKGFISFLPAPVHVILLCIFLSVT